MILYKEDLIMDNFSSQGTIVQGRTNIEDRRILQEDTTNEDNNENQQRIENTYHHIMSEINSESNTLEHAIQSSNQDNPIDPRASGTNNEEWNVINCSFEDGWGYPLL